MTFPLTPRDHYDVVVTREARHWVLEVEGVGATNVRRLTEADDWVRDLVATMTDQPVPDSTTFRYTVAGKLGDQIREVRRRQEAAEEQAAAAAAAAKALVGEMVLHEGISQADAAKALGVSKQRVSQLVR
ncbi:hypothetical protein GGQ22_15640 [Nocardioides sp. zg-579]|uniref:Helix-turn-helix domain-containing protein n=1 Tax=Nocardioides marmotae TaxID=2663857 RepID=A0A6I3JEH0_9ACTN|nr:helix-turn-helix transcriptional regulator [Nocardioides marmotae]MCR6032857.1 hypothetical protein [Gordonia jinghuaiqii]MTB96507.1 hypothetical protein [Nocardioides marmotae]QKE01971.1 hypothetical protein HPC71_13490 [Nocardioides marmotae]